MSNENPFDTTYDTVPGAQVVGYDSDTDKYNTLHVDVNGHIYTKILGTNGDGDAQEGVVEGDGALIVTTRPQALDTLIDEASATVTYIGKAATGTAATSSLWSIKKINEAANPIEITYADGDGGFSKRWDQRTTYEY